MSDPVADKSTFLCMYMSNHPDTLVAYVKYWGKVAGPVSSAKMSSIDSEGMTLEYKLKDRGEEKRSVRVQFDPPLSGYEEVKPRLLSMTADAQESLGMSKSPHISTFEIDSGVFKVVGALGLFIYSSLAPRFSGPQWEVGQWLYRTCGGYTVFKYIWITTIAIHIAEGLYVQRLCVRHRTGFVVGLKYVLATLIFGVTVLSPLRQRIQKARIDSIMKGN